MKILQGAECNVDVVGADSVDHLKDLVKVWIKARSYAAERPTYFYNSI